METELKDPKEEPKQIGLEIRVVKPGPEGRLMRGTCPNCLSELECDVRAGSALVIGSRVSNRWCTCPACGVTDVPMNEL